MSGFFNFENKGDGKRKDFFGLPVEQQHHMEERGDGRDRRQRFNEYCTNMKEYEWIF